jgi:hypothetical protein
MSSSASRRRWARDEVGLASTSVVASAFAVHPSPKAAPPRSSPRATAAAAQRVGQLPEQAGAGVGHPDPRRDQHEGGEPRRPAGGVAEAEQGRALGHEEQHGQVVRVGQPAAAGERRAEGVQGAGELEGLDAEGLAPGRLHHAEDGLGHADAGHSPEDQRPGRRAAEGEPGHGDDGEPGAEAEGEGQPEPGRVGDQGDADADGVDRRRHAGQAGAQQTGPDRAVEERPGRGGHQHQVEQGHDDRAVPVVRAPGRRPHRLGDGQGQGDDEGDDQPGGDAPVLVRRVSGRRTELVRCGRRVGTGGGVAPHRRLGLGHDPPSAPGGPM